MRNYFHIPSLLRLAEHQALSKVTLSGSVLDLGGDTHSTYQSLCKGTYTLTTVNLNTKTAPDILHDLETPLPLRDSTYDGVLLINVLEHVFAYEQLLSEAVRVVKPQGKIVIVVPFLFPVHPSPHDYHRFTKETLEKECASRGLTNIEVTALGGGVFSAQYVLLDRLFPWPLRFLGYFTARYFVQLYDILFTFLARLTKRKYDPADYALGYCVTATKR